MDAFPVLRHMLWFRRASALDADSLERLQERRLASLVRAASTASYYSGMKLPDSPAALADLPLTEKDAVRSHPESFIASGRAPTSLKSITTSGSSGTPTKIYLDDAVEHYRLGARYACDMSFGRSPFGLYAKIYYGEGGRHPLRRHLGVFPEMFLSLFSSNEDNYALLRGRRPEVMRGYPSAILGLAKLNRPSTGPVRLKSVISNAEILSEPVRREIEESFSCRVFNHYGSIEASSIARECPHGSMHVDCFSCIVEIVDEKGRPRKGGEGEIVVTPLFNTVMPLLRYRIGDRGSWGKCNCGSALPVLKEISGRSDDRIVLPSGAIRPGVAFYQSIPVTSVRSYQIVQEAPDLMVFRYVPFGKPMPAAEEQSIRDGILRACLGEPVQVEFEAVDSIPRDKSGKIRTIVSKALSKKL